MARPVGSKNVAPVRVAKTDKPDWTFADAKRPGVGDVALKLARLGCDPFLGMARIAMNRSNPLDVRSRMYAELAQYLAPKRKAIEHSADLPTLEALLGKLPKIIEHDG